MRTWLAALAAMLLGGCVVVQPVPVRAPAYGSPAADAAAAGAIIGGLIGAAAAEADERRYYAPKDAYHYRY